MKLFYCRRSDARSQRAPATSSRVQMFLSTLPYARRTTIAARPRFYRIPWIRHAGEADSDPDNFLP